MMGERDGPWGEVHEAPWTYGYSTNATDPLQLLQAHFLSSHGPPS